STTTSAHTSEQAPPPLFSLAYAMAVVAVHFYFVSYTMSLVEIPRALAGHPAWLVGLVVGSFGIAGMITRPLVGILVDGGKRQRWLRLGAIGTVLAFIGYALEFGPWTTMIFRALHGVAMGAFTTALLSIVGSRLPPARRGLGIGLYYSSSSVSGLYGAAMAVWLFEDFSLQLAFLVSAGAAVLAMIFGALTGPGSGEAAPLPPGQKRVRPPLFSPTGLLPAVVFLAMTTPWGAINAFLPLFAEERSLGNPGLFYTAVAVAQLTARALAGAISDRFGRASVVVPSLAAGVVGLMLLATAQSPVMLMVSALLVGLGLAGTQTAIVALIVDRTPPAALGSGMATFTMAWDVGQVIGSIGLGVVAGVTSYSFVFGLCAISPAIGMAVFLLRVWKAAPPAPPGASTPVEAR
ncbi:MAG: MFS transporter, partial [Chloroflexi bacterium]|nr:MFS transporter [Chloroflexota bacterium]